MTPIAYDPQALAQRFHSPSVHHYLADAGANFDHLQSMFEDSPSLWSDATPRSGRKHKTDLFPRDEYYLNNRPTRAIIEGQ